MRFHWTLFVSLTGLKSTALNQGNSKVWPGCPTVGKKTQKGKPLPARLQLISDG